MTQTLDFEKFVDDTNLDFDDYPFAKNGPAKQSRTYAALVWAIVFAAIWGLIAWLFKPQRFIDFYNARDFSGSWAPFEEPVYMFCNFFIEHAGDITRWTSIIVLIPLAIFVFFEVDYSINVFRRQRHFERDVRKNDRLALKLKNSLIKSKRVNERYNRVKQKINESTKPKGDGAFARAGVPDLNDEAEREALEAFRDMTVMINTRESTLDFGEVQTRYFIEFMAPAGEDAHKKLDEMTSGLDNQIRRDLHEIMSRDKNVKNESFSVSERIESSSKDRFYFTQSMQSVDRYAKPMYDDVEVETVEYETAFPLDMFVDHSKYNNEMRKRAEAFAAQNASTIDSLLSTHDMSANRKGYDVGATSILYTYTMPVSFKSSNVDGLKHSLDKMFNTKNSDVHVTGSEMKVSFPVPKNMKLKIDVKSMYEGAFF